MFLDNVKFDTTKEILLIKQKNPDIEDDVLKTIIKKRFFNKFNTTLEESFNKHIKHIDNELEKEIYKELQDELFKRTLISLPDNFYFYVKDRPATIFNAFFIPASKQYEISFFTLTDLESSVYDEGVVLNKIKDGLWIITDYKQG